MYVHIGEVIKECRVKKGWSKNQLSRYSQVNRHTIDRVENTGHGTLNNVEKMLGAMGYELEVVPRCGR